MEKPEKLEPEEYLASLSKANPELRQQAEEFNQEAEGKIFWSDEQLIARFRRDEEEYENFLAWIVSVREMMLKYWDKIAFFGERGAVFSGDLAEARNLEMWGHTAEDPEEVFRMKARKVNMLRGDLVAIGISSELFTESKYGAWKQSRVHESNG